MAAIYRGTLGLIGNTSGGDNECGEGIRFGGNSACEAGVF